MKLVSITSLKNWLDMRNKNAYHDSQFFGLDIQWMMIIGYQDMKYRSQNRFGEKVSSTLNLVFLRHLRNILVKIFNGQLDSV